MQVMVRRAREDIGEGRNADYQIGEADLQGEEERHQEEDEQEKQRRQDDEPAPRIARPLEDGRVNDRPLPPCRQDKLSAVSTQRESAAPAAAAPPGGGRSRRSRQRQRLIDACIAALHLYGPSRTTVEKVVALAGLSPGIVRFYFDSKDAMLVASLAYLAAEFQEHVLNPV